MKALVLMVLLMLTGCATVKPTPKVEIPASLLQECPALDKLQGTTGKDLLKNIATNAKIYHACADSKRALIEAVASDK